MPRKTGELSPEIIITLSTAGAALLGGVALVIKAWRKPPVSRDSALPPVPRQAAWPKAETLESRVSRLEEGRAGDALRIAACEATDRSVQEDLDEMREHIHAVEKGAIERQGQTNEKLAEIIGARSTRGRAR